jgi:hypothetical protein
MSSDHEAEIRASVAAHQDLGPGYDDAVAEGLVERIGAEIDKRIDARLGQFGVAKAAGPGGYQGPGAPAGAQPGVPAPAGAAGVPGAGGLPGPAAGGAGGVVGAGAPWDAGPAGLGPGLPGPGLPGPGLPGPGLPGPGLPGPGLAGPGLPGPGSPGGYQGYQAPIGYQGYQGYQGYMGPVVPPGYQMGPPPVRPSTVGQRNVATTITALGSIALGVGATAIVSRANNPGGQAFMVLLIWVAIAIVNVAYARRP